MANGCGKKIGCGGYVFVHARRSIVGIPPISTLTILELTILEHLVSTHIVSTLTISTLSMLQRSIDALPAMLQRSTYARVLSAVSASAESLDAFF